MRVYHSKHRNNLAIGPHRKEFLREFKEIKAQLDQAKNFSKEDPYKNRSKVQIDKIKMIRIK